MKNYPTLYKQGDYSDFLGSSTVVTIAQGGCFLVAGAMKLAYYGINITPPDLNKLLIQKSLYLDGDLLADNWMSQAYNQLNYKSTYNYESIPTDLNSIQTLLADPATTLTLRINLGNGNLHFVEAISCDGITLHIANPWTGEIEDFTKNYGNPITAMLHVIVYTGPIPQLVVTQPTTTPSSPLAQTFANAVTKSKNFDTVAQFFGMSNDTAITTTAGQTVVNQIKALQGQVKESQQTINDLQDKIVTLSKAQPVLPNAGIAPISLSLQAVTVTPTEVPTNTADLTATVVQPSFSDGKPAVASQPFPAPATPAIPWIKRRQQENLAAKQAAKENFLIRIFKVLFF